jgi:hypothetical protein
VVEHSLGKGCQSKLYKLIKVRRMPVLMDYTNKVERIDLETRHYGSFVDFPQDERLAAFDHSDRKIRGGLAQMWRFRAECNGYRLVGPSASPG